MMVEEKADVEVATRWYGSEETQVMVEAKEDVGVARTRW